MEKYQNCTVLDTDLASIGNGIEFDSYFSPKNANAAKR